MSVCKLFSTCITLLDTPHTHSPIHKHTHTFMQIQQDRREERKREEGVVPQCMCVCSELRTRMEGLNQQASGGALQSRTPLVKSQTLGGP